MMLNGVEVFCHSSIKISKNKIIYIDPFRIDKNYNDADYIFITHEHYDHFSTEDINKVIKDSTVIIIPESMIDKVIKAGLRNKIITVLPNKEYSCYDIVFKTVSSYNVNKEFHPKQNNWVGYIIHINNFSYYVAGDTDCIDDILDIECDVAFVPVGGTYTMTYKEAASLVNKLNPKIAIPTHYGEIVGIKGDGESFINLLNDSIQGMILIK